MHVSLAVALNETSGISKCLYLSKVHPVSQIIVEVIKRICLTLHNGSLVGDASHVIVYNYAAI